MQPATKDTPKANVLTGPYIHNPDNIAFVSFETEGETPRSFSILIAEGMIFEGEEYPANGIAVLDNDNVAIVFDQAYEQDVNGQGPSRDQRTAFNFLQALGWQEFSYFCRTRDTYRNGIEDIDVKTAIPNEGNRESQVRIGALDPAFIDNRSDLIRSLNASPDLPYAFPRASRESMVTEIMAHDVFYSEGGSPSSLAWDVRMNFDWNKTGRIVDGEEVCQTMDDKWDAEMRDNKSIFDAACDACLDPFISSNFSPFEIEDMEAELDVRGGNNGFVALKKYNDQDMTFSDIDELHGKLETLSDEDIMGLWLTVRTLDVDLSRDVRAADLAVQLNESRAELEQEWLNEYEDALVFDGPEDVRF
ncbi:MAG: hypothetical protein ABJN42_07490 [Roseibium sp.]|uniref:hypothetical protein n=1 Tax=Roseibium sp. TaxID=1936156 RepID=UPI003299CD48